LFKNCIVLYCFVSSYRILLYRIVSYRIVTVLLFVAVNTKVKCVQLML